MGKPRSIFNETLSLITKHKIMSIEPFYMVYLEGGNTPAFKHNDLENAENEAKRLAKIHEKKAFVLCSIKSIEIVKFKIEDCRPYGEDLPF